MRYSFHRRPVKVNLQHMKAHADVMQHLNKALDTIPEDQQFNGTTVITVDMGKIVGRTGCVETVEGDDVVHTLRPGRIHPSRCVRGKLGAETSKITLVMRKGDVHLRVITAWIGEKAPREPADPTMNEEERQQSIAFWANHALVI